MNYFLFKLQFTTPVHFGPSDSALSLYTSKETFCADTLFSALCHTALSAAGAPAVQALCRDVQQGRLALSDGMPWRGDVCFLPRPCALAQAGQELEGRRRKAMKKLEWVPAVELDAFAASLRGGALYDPTRCETQFGVHSERTQVSKADGEPTPYQVGLFSFLPGCGLYFLAGCEDDAQAQRLAGLVKLLGLSGMGGKTSAGLGRFSLAECTDLQTSGDAQAQRIGAALRADAPGYLLLTTSLPADGELEGALEGAGYRLVRRGGFVQPGAAQPQARKKATQYMLAAGAVLRRRFAGGLYEVGGREDQPVYRYSVPLLMGVSL